MLFHKLGGWMPTRMLGAMAAVALARSPARIR